MTALSSTQVNEVLDRYKPAQRFEVLRGFLKQKRSKQERTLRSHFREPIVDKDEVEVRDTLDELLEMAGAIEIVALATGALPEFEEKFQMQVTSILCNDAVRNYYSANYPLPLPILLRNQLAPSVLCSAARNPIQRASADRKEESIAFLLTFFELETRRRRSRDLVSFFYLLDGYRINDFSVADLLEILGDKEKLERIMHKGSQTKTIDARALNGLNQFITFCADLDDLCDHCLDQPIVRAAIFLHFCYWFRERGHYLRATTNKLEERLKRLTAAIKSAGLNNAPRQAHAQLDASASFFGERVDSFVQLIDKLTNWEPYAKPLILAASRLLDAWARPQTRHAT